MSDRYLEPIAATNPRYLCLPAAVEPGDGLDDKIATRIQVGIAFRAGAFVRVTLARGVIPEGGTQADVVWEDEEVRDLPTLDRVEIIPNLWPRFGAIDV